ncbi:G patch domain-containing protein 4 [Triplophysa tibetana]|uniref:G patch domain-containing protein 4 n=1 Tax=Triplophysa tibetana TaxID=1572043 RepID=A0A5A9N207_9TELE|nr:G patch domain-containing protein 4 [Triplophysa tibetana]
MAETTREKATGLKFAEQLLLRHGWEKGKGLGRRENGISEAIKVQIKRDKGGMGHKEGEQFTFHWWDHVFNKASSSLVVETGQDGVMVKAENDSGNVLISNKKPRKAQLAKSMLYGSFVKSATLLSGQKHTEKTSDSDDCSSSNSEDEDQKLDLSSTTKLSDADLMKACGGRTAHKGARHGLTMSAKLARLQQQEQEFMNKYGKKNQTAATCTSSQVCKNVTSLNHEDNPDVTEKTKRKKAKRKEPSENDVCDGKTATDIYEGNDFEDMKKNEDSNAFVNDDSMTTAEPRKKKKRNREVKTTPEESFDGHCNSASHASEEPQLKSNKTASFLPTMKEDKPKKEKKKRLVADLISEDSKKIKPQELLETSYNVSKQKRKKKSSMDHYASSLTDTSMMMITEDTNKEEQNMDMETGGQKRKKNKKVREIEEQDVGEKVTLEDSVPKKKKKKAKN